MTTEVAASEAHHDDGLDIDFGLGAPQVVSAAQTSTQPSSIIEQNNLAGKPEATTTNLEPAIVESSGRAPSEINYDSDGDADHLKEAPLSIMHDNDEITWDDADDGAGDEEEYDAVANDASNMKVDTPDVADGTSLESATEPVMNGLEGMPAGNVVSGVLEPVPEAYYPAGEDNGYELENPESQGEDTYEEDGHPHPSFEHQNGHDHEDLANGYEQDADVVEPEDEEYDEVDVDDTMADDVNEDDNYAGEEESDDTGSSVPEVQVQFAGNKYSLFRDPNDNNKPYILEDSLFQARASELLDALHDALGDEISDGDELVVQVQELCLEISPMMASTLQSMSISDFAHLHAKLVANDEAQESHPLKLTIVSKPAFSTRYQELLAGVKQGVGLSQVSRQFDTGQGVLYSSPIKNELGDIVEYPEEDAEYDQSAEDVEDEGEEDDSNEVSLAGDDDGEAEDMTDEASDEAGHDGGMREDEEGEYYDQDEIGEEAEYAEEDDHAADYGNEEPMEEYGSHPVDDSHHGTQGDSTSTAHIAENSYMPSNSVGDQTGFAETALVSEPVAGSVHADAIDWVDDEPGEDGAQEDTAHVMNSNMDAPATAAHDTTTAASRHSSPSVTIDGDNDADDDALELQVDVGLGAEETTTLEENHPKPPAVDEISWEGDDDEDGVPEPQTSNMSGNVNGKRQYPGDEDELHEGDDAVDFKRRRSS